MDMLVWYCRAADRIPLWSHSYDLSSFYLIKTWTSCFLLPNEITDGATYFALDGILCWYFSKQEQEYKNECNTINISNKWYGYKFIVCSSWILNKVMAKLLSEWAFPDFIAILKSTMNRQNRVGNMWVIAISSITNTLNQSFVVRLHSWRYNFEIFQ